MPKTPVERTTPGNHKSDVPFFNRNPQDWSIQAYLQSVTLPNEKTPIEILGRWKTALRQIQACKRYRCCNKDSRRRATELLEQYGRKGDASDRHYGKQWCTDAERRTASSQAATTTVYGAVYNAPTINGPTINGPTINGPSIIGSSGDIDINVGSTGDDEQQDEPHNTVGQRSSEDESESDDDIDDEFKSAYESFNDEKKWRLKTGVVVEDVLYKAYRKESSSATAAAHSGRNWVIDLGDDSMRRLFKPEEWDEITDSLPKLPSPNEDLVLYLSRFYNVRTTEKLREVLRNTSYLPQDMPYNRDEHFDLEWAELVLRGLLVLYETPGQPLCGTHRGEGWYASNVWSLILHRCFLSLPYMNLESTEAACQATSLRKNRGRTDTTARLASGGRLDGVVCTYEEDPYEFAGLEIARTFHGGTNSTKWLRDSRKLVRALRDMLHRLHQRVGPTTDPVIAGKLQVFGIVTAGLSLQISRLVNPHGYVCLVKAQKVRQVPSTVGELENLLFLLKSVVQMKAVIAECVDVVRAKRPATSPEELAQALMKDDDDDTTDRTSLPWNAPTP